MTASELTSEVISMEPAMIRTARTLTKDPDSALDLVQDTYLRVLLHGGSIKHSGNIPGWLYRVMKNRFMDNMNERQFFLRQEIEEINEPSVYMADENEILATIDGLPDHYRRVFKLHIDGYTIKEISSMTRIPIGTIKCSLHRGRKILAKLLDL